MCLLLDSLHVFHVLFSQTLCDCWIRSACALPETEMLICAIAMVNWIFWCLPFVLLPKSIFSLI